MFGKYPLSRLRRNRKNSWIRDIVAETNLSSGDLIYPIFIHGGTEEKIEISSMPGVFRFSIKAALEELKHVQSLGIRAINIFPVISQELKSNDCAEGVREGNLVYTAIATIKDKINDIGIITDLAFDPYTSHGHDGIMINGKIDNDETVKQLQKQALIFAKAGADMVAPSDMMDGRVKAIREILDANNYKDVGIISYSAKYASCFYGPFRDAVGSKTNIGNSDKSTYQMDFRNSNEAYREVSQDIEEGSDMIIVKPGLPYLDIVKGITTNFNIPTLVYQVSGEFSMIKAAAQRGWIQEDKAFYESVLACKRAGASAILTYYAKELAELLN